MKRFFWILFLEIKDAFPFIFDSCEGVYWWEPVIYSPPTIRMTKINTEAVAAAFVALANTGVTAEQMIKSFTEQAQPLAKSFQKSLSKTDRLDFLICRIDAKYQSMFDFKYKNPVIVSHFSDCFGFIFK